MLSLHLNDSWDIHTDETGKIRVTDESYGVAQSAANAIRLFTKDAYFDQTKGIPHFDIELGKPFSVSEAVIINRIRQACMNIDGVTDARVNLETDGDGRYLGGNVYITTKAGTVSVEI